MADPRERPSIPECNRAEGRHTSWHADEVYNQITESRFDPLLSPRAALRFGHGPWEIWHEHLKYRREISEYPDAFPSLDILGTTGRLIDTYRALESEFDP